MLTSSWIPICSGSFLIFIFSTGFLLIVTHRRKLRNNVANWHSRPPLSDSNFLATCKISEEAFNQKVALAARRAVASLATVPAETILPDDSFARDLVHLPFWDSLDWLGFVFEVEKQASNEIRIHSNIVDGAVKLAGSYKELKVKHIVLAVVIAAHSAPSREA